MSEQQKKILTREEIAIALSRLSEELITSGRAVKTVNAISVLIQMVHAAQHSVTEAEQLQFLEVAASLAVSGMLYEKSVAARSPRRVVDTVADGAAAGDGPKIIMPAAGILKPQ